MAVRCPILRTPATIMETSGAIIDADETARLLEREDLHFLAEMMNYPGVLNKDPEVMRKIEAAKNAGKPIVTDIIP